MVAIVASSSLFQVVTYIDVFRFVLPLLDRNRHVPVQNIPFPISRNTEFVFPSGLSVLVSVPDQKIQERE